VVDTRVTLKRLFAPVGSGPDNPPGEPDPPEGRRQIHVAYEPLAQVLGVLDAGPLGAEFKEPHQPEFQAGPGEVPGDGEPCYSPAVWYLTHGPLLPCGHRFRVAPPLANRLALGCDARQISSSLARACLHRHRAATSRVPVYLWRMLADIVDNFINTYLGQDPKK